MWGVVFTACVIFFFNTVPNTKVGFIFLAHAGSPNCHCFRTLVISLLAVNAYVRFFYAQITLPLTLHYFGSDHSVDHP
jgi:hypothetical protein